jgi:hypothetical protein
MKKNWRVELNTALMRNELPYRTWNEAEDLRIEQMLKESGVKLPEMTVEEIYTELTKGETK